MSGENEFPRRTFLKGAAAAGLGVAAAGGLIEAVTGLGAHDHEHAASAAGPIYTEEFPTSPLIGGTGVDANGKAVGSTFTDPLPIPKALKPVPKSVYSGWSNPPGPGAGQQSSLNNEKHQIWPNNPKVGQTADPIVYQIKLQVNEHAFTTSKVLPINNSGQPTNSFDSTGTSVPAAVRALPKSTIYGFNGTFPGSRINAEYGKAALIRFENHLDENPNNLNRGDFGAPDMSFLTHLHNGHTAPESDGNPNYSMNAGPKWHGYRPGMTVDNLYLNWPAGGDDREKQTFFWFHDHRMDHTGSNVYKGMVGLYPIYDPKNNLDMGDERLGYRLPGVRTNYNPDGTIASGTTSFFDVEYDIPLAFYDCRLDDGVTIHNDFHNDEFPEAGNPRTHPEWWGKTFYRHMPNHGFVGDIFTVNGTANPVLEVKRRKYRLRFLDASISRCYEFKLMSSTQGPKSAASLGYGGDELQGQYRIPDGQQSMKFVQIATDGGLIPTPITRDSFELWPAKRREFIVDFTKYMDGTPTKKGDVIYLTNVMKMKDGRAMNNSSRMGLDPNYKIPVMKIVIGDDAPDNSQIPTALRAIPNPRQGWQTLLDNRLIFEVQRGSFGGETEWLINGLPFDPMTPMRSLKNPAGNTPLASQKTGSFNLWEIRNGGGGWVHPFHLHMEEHRTMLRNGKAVPPADAGHPDDVSKEDLINLDGSESVIIYRGFRDFVGKYVAHCHNLAHEDHAMMFGWDITP